MLLLVTALSLNLLVTITDSILSVRSEHVASVSGFYAVQLPFEHKGSRGKVA